MKIVEIPNPPRVTEEGRPGNGRPEAGTTTYPQVRRKVAPGHILKEGSREWPEGSIVQMPSDVSFPLEVSGTLLKMS